MPPCPPPPACFPPWPSPALFALCGPQTHDNTHAIACLRVWGSGGIAAKMLPAILHGVATSTGKAKGDTDSGSEVLRAYLDKGHAAPCYQDAPLYVVSSGALHDHIPLPCPLHRRARENRDPRKADWRCPSLARGGAEALDWTCRRRRACAAGGLGARPPLLRGTLPCLPSHVDHTPVPRPVCV